MKTDRQPEQRETPEQGPPEPFVEQVKEALEHLYDLHYLQQHPLAQGDESTTGQHLRRKLAAAVEALSPGTDVPFRAPQARSYNLVRLHYVQGMTVQEAAHRLGISLRQAYRDLRRGERSVATVLWARRSAPSQQEPSADQLTSIQAEIAQLETHPRSTDIRPLLEYAQSAVERLAQRQGITLHVELSREPVVVSADPVVARQVLVNALSHAVQQAQPGDLQLALEVGDEQAALVLRYEPKPEAASAPAVNLVVVQLADRLGWTVSQAEEPWGIRTVTLHMTPHGLTVLVIDDNEGLVNLLERYLTDLACRVVAAADGQEGLRLAQEVTPDAIILDVMMPEMDGWELLQRLHTHPKTANIPVVICSVINDPELAYSLGASLFLPKPVSREEILAALRQLGVL